nr:MAG TPA: hypothetical protein [Caudoviricetes sp.]
MNTSFDITDIDCAPKELEDALGVSDCLSALTAVHLDFLIRIPVGGHVIVLRMRGDAIHQVIRDLELALAGGVGSCGIAAQGAGE